MKKAFIADLKEGDSLYGEVFAIKSYIKKASRNNKPYIDLELTDRTGLIKAKIWSEDLPNCETAHEGDVVEINGTVEKHNGLYIKITNLKITNNYNLSDIQQKTLFDISKMWEDIQKAIDDIKNPHIKLLLSNIFNEDFIETFQKAPAAYRVHHAYVGGLLEHTWEMLEMSRSIKEHFPKVNLDLVRAGIILHDCGKAVELKIGTTIDISDKGKLLGHIYLGTELISKNKPQNMPDDLYNEILHIVLSHHGELQFGSPVPPMTTEAIIVNVLDIASSRINIAYGHIHNTLGTEKYTPFVSQLGTELYRSPYIDNLTNEDVPF